MTKRDTRCIRVHRDTADMLKRAAEAKGMTIIEAAHYAAHALDAQPKTVTALMRVSEKLHDLEQRQKAARGLVGQLEAKVNALKAENRTLRNAIAEDTRGGWPGPLRWLRRKGA